MSHSIEAIAAELAQRIPLLSPFTPEGWIDFRSGFSRGW